MNKDELLREIVAKTGIPYKTTNAVVDSILNLIENTVASGERVALIGFGTFVSQKREARIGRNPQNGEEIKIPAKIVPVFTVGKKFRELVK